MNKTLILARHGKAEKVNFGENDLKRNLTERGNTNVLKVSEELSKIITPQLIVSSPANRAYQTAKLFAKTFRIDKKEIALNEAIYEASMSDLLKVINQLDNTFDCILMTGHNPAFEYAVDYFTGIQIGDLPTSGTAILNFPFNDWKMISQGTAELNKILIP
jgi:phosphohistidine phosphatase